METIFIHTSKNKGDLLSIKKSSNLPIKLSFYVFKKQQPHTIPIYLVNTTNNNKYFANKIWNNKHKINNNRFIVNTFWVYSKKILPFNLTHLSIGSNKNKFLSINRDKNSNNERFSFYMFEDIHNLKLYPLTIVIWPCALHISNKIKLDLSQHFHIISDKYLKVDNYKKLVYNLYEGDLKCDKSKLVHKIKRFNQYDKKIRSFNILIKNPYLDNKNISNTSIDLKRRIRSKYKKYIDNYFYDIIIHTSDNQDHASSMNNILNKLVPFS